MRNKDDGRQMTRWLNGAQREPSVYAGGGMMANRDWVEKERETLARKGVRVTVVENPSVPGFFALFRVQAEKEETDGVS